MSHLSILPTVLTDLDLLEETLLAQHYVVQRPGFIQAFGQEVFPSELVATNGDGIQFGWRRDLGGSLELLVDLGQTKHALGHQKRLQDILRGYALRSALRSADGMTFEPQVSSINPIGAERTMG